MQGVNKAIVIGCLGDDPVIRSFDNGNRSASFSLATAESWKDKNTGERKERTDWHRIVVFNEQLVKLAEQCLKKGSKAYVEGQMKTRDFMKNGVKTWVTEVVLTNFNGQILLLDKAASDRPPPATPDDYGRDGF